AQRMRSRRCCAIPRRLSKARSRRVFRSTQVTGCPPQFPSGLVAERCVDLFERAEEAAEMLFEVLRATVIVAKITVLKLARERDDSGSHHPILVRSLGPREPVW